MISIRQTPVRFAGIALATVLALAGTAHADVLLAPELAGLYAAGKGVDGQFLKVDDNWHGSSVLWNEETRSFGSGVAIGSLDWGTGLWGLADLRTAYETPSMIQHAWSGRASPISYGNAAYDTEWSEDWGKVPMAPLFAPSGPSAGQTNWTSHFDGYIRITEAGTYNFGVLADDGFFFSLGGASNGAPNTLSLESDFLSPRERVGFKSNLQLDVGLYSFELGAFDRLEVGVVQLSWMRDGADWSVVPIENLVHPGEVVLVPEPSSWALMFAGLLAIGSIAARRRGASRADRG